jgi:hypothetical protein
MYLKIVCYFTRPSVPHVFLMQIQIKCYKAGSNTDIITQVSKSDIPCTSLNLYHTGKKVQLGPDVNEIDLSMSKKWASIALSQ